MKPSARQNENVDALSPNRSPTVIAAHVEPGRVLSDVGARENALVHGPFFLVLVGCECLVPIVREIAGHHGHAGFDHRFDDLIAELFELLHAVGIAEMSDVNIGDLIERCECALARVIEHSYMHEVEQMLAGAAEKFLGRGAAMQDAHRQQQQRGE